MKRCVLAPLLLLAACAQAPSGTNGASENWPTPGGDAGKSHHSQLTGITPGNVDTLGLAWASDLNTNRVLEATPVEIDGVLYTSGGTREGRH